MEFVLKAGVFTIFLKMTGGRWVTVEEDLDMS